MSICIYMVRLSLVSELSYNNTYTPLFTRKISLNHSLHSLSFVGMSSVVGGPGSGWSGQWRCCLHMFAYTGPPPPPRPGRWENWLSAADFLGGEDRVVSLKRLWEEKLRKWALTACCPHTSQPTTASCPFRGSLAWSQERPTGIENILKWFWQGTLSSFLDLAVWYSLAMLFRPRMGILYAMEWLPTIAELPKSSLVWQKIEKK